jgi:hypothetical protein
MEEKQITPPVDERDEAFQNLRDAITEGPIDPMYKIKLLDALVAYIQTLKP